MKWGFFDWYWATWLAAFLGPELYWVVTNSQGTLSWSFWDLESINMAQPFDFPMWTSVHWAVACFVWLLFLWLSLHIPFGLLRLCTGSHNSERRCVVRYDLAGLLVLVLVIILIILLLTGRL